MQTKEINPIPLQQFTQLVKAADASKQKEIRMDINSAKQLNYTLTVMLARIAGDYEDLIRNSASGKEEIISVQVDGGKL